MGARGSECYPNYTYILLLKGGNKVEMEKNTAPQAEQTGGFKPGLLLGLLIGAGCFWLTIKLVFFISH